MTTRPTRKPLDSIVPWAVTAIVIGALGFVIAAAAMAHNWRPGWGNYLIAFLAAAYLGAGARALAGWRFGKHRDLRQALITLAAQRRDGVWLNRDEHMVFWADRKFPMLMRTWTVMRLGEDVMRELDTDGPVRTAVAYERFIIFPFARTVVRADEAALVTQDEDGHIDGGNLPGTPGTLVSMWRTLRMSRHLGVGTGWAAPDQVRELVSQFTAAERMGDKPST